MRLWLLVCVVNVDQISSPDRGTKHSQGGGHITAMLPVPTNGSRLSVCLWGDFFSSCVIHAPKCPGTSPRSGDSRPSEQLSSSWKDKPGSPLHLMTCCHFAFFLHQTTFLFCGCRRDAGKNLLHICLPNCFSRERLRGEGDFLMGPLGSLTLEANWNF